jgi:hypothetical protein
MTRRTAPGFFFVERSQGVCMADDFSMRLQLQKVVAYRELCRGVRRSGRENVTFALIMLMIWYFTGQNAWAVPIVLAILVSAELLVGLFKWLLPSAEGFLLDGVVLLCFAAYNLMFLYLQFQANAGKLDWVFVFLAAYMMYLAFTRFRLYRQISRLFADRPTAEHIAWFDELIHEIRTADPQTDELLLDLPTSPHWKAKLLGTTAFFVGLRGPEVLVLGPEEFELLREKKDRGTETRRALLRIHERAFPEFGIDSATWENYQRWRTATPATFTDQPEDTHDQ